MYALSAALLLAIRLYDNTGLPIADLHAAARNAADVLRAAGIDARFVVCPPRDNSTGCIGLPADGELVVRIVRTPSHDADLGDTLGYASVDTVQHRGVLATVFADRSAALASRAGIEETTVIGYAVAHEVGHLLLGTSAHARSGLMRPRWSVSELQRRTSRDWRFSTGESATLRARLDERRRTDLSHN
jgi:hypothetical protein